MLELRQLVYQEKEKNYEEVYSFNVDSSSFCWWLLCTDSNC